MSFLNGRAKFKAFKFLIYLLCFALAILPKFISQLIFKIVFSWGSSVGVGVRYCCMKRLCKKIGDNVYIARNVYFFSLEYLEIGNNVSIHPMCYIDASGGLKIGDNVSIAHATTIVTGNHTWANKDLPIKYNPIIFKSVILEDDIWVGSGVRILGGVNIGTRSIIAAGSVVTKDVRNNSLVAGVPALKIKDI